MLVTTSGTNRFDLQQSYDIKNLAQLSNYLQRVVKNYTCGLRTSMLHD